MAAGMWRIPASKVVKGGSLSIIQDRGVLRSAPPGSNGFYLFSEVGAGVQPLALIGHWHEVLNFLAKRPQGGIHNRIASLPEIYMGTSYYRPGQRFVGLFPVHDTVDQLVSAAASFAPGNTITDIGGAIADAVGIGKSLFGGKKKKKPSSLGSNEVYVKFSYLPEEGMTRIGSGKVTFEQLYPTLLATLSAKAGTA